MARVIFPDAAATAGLAINATGVRSIALLDSIVTPHFLANSHKVMLTLSILQHQWRAPPLKCRPFERRSIPDRLAVLPEIRASPINATDGSGTTKVCRRTP